MFFKVVCIILLAFPIKIASATEPATEIAALTSEVVAKTADCSVVRRELAFTAFAAGGIEPFLKFLVTRSQARPNMLSRFTWLESRKIPRECFTLAEDHNSLVIITDRNEYTLYSNHQNPLVVVSLAAEIQ